MPGSLCGRGTYILDPGLNSYLSRQDILQHANYYGSKGFSRNFLWYAPVQDRVFQPGNTETWSSCAIDMPTDQVCTDEADDFHVVVNAFSDDDERGLPIRVRSLSYGAGFIALACGNFSERTSEPVPVISGYKFHDHDRDGVRDAGEPGLAGWRMTLHRDSSDAGQSLGPVTSTVTNSSGYYEFRLDGQYPGRYAVTEQNKPDWTRTTSPARHTIDVNPGIGAAEFAGNNFGNVETTADVVKTSFTVLDPPEELQADTEHTLRVRAALENRGPAPIVDVKDTISASGPPDCTFNPQTKAVTRRLVLDQPVEVIFEISVICTEPSSHTFTFDNLLEITTPGVTDPDDSSNRRSADATIAVIDESDVRVADTNLDCVARTYVDTGFTCTVTAAVENAGDYGPATADVVLGLTGPDDCELNPNGSTRHEDVAIATDSPTVADSSWQVVCADRSYHDFGATSEVVLDHLHVRDPDDSNNNGSAADRVEVFELVDLSVADIRITCSEREYETHDITCESTVTIANAGPATDVATKTVVEFTAPETCTVDPAANQEDTRVLDAGEDAEFSKTWSLTCTDDRRHTFGTSATISADEPHPEDTDRSNDSAAISWQPIDIKPRSFPSSVNIDKLGVVPIAVLSTLEFDAFAEVDRETLTFGAEGTEASWVGCGGSPEDVNGDGLLDLVCRFDAKLASLSCADTTATLMGRTTDGRRFEGQDDINITGC